MTAITDSRRQGLACLAAILAFSAPALAAEPGAGPWSEGKLSAARLIAGGFRDGAYSAGVEIALKGKAHTYWRNPGDAGAPPVFNFGASRNLAGAQAMFPAPTRIIEDGSDVFGYLGGVILPLDVKPADPLLPVELALDLQYAACERICIPVEAHLKLTLSPADGPSDAGARLSQTIAALPKPLEASGAKVTLARAPGGGKPSWVLTIDPSPGPSGDVFAEAPENWFFSSKRRPDGAFDLVAEEKPADAPAGVDVQLTLVGGGNARTATAHLDARAATP